MADIFFYKKDQGRFDDHDNIDIKNFCLINGKFYYYNICCSIDTDIEDEFYKNSIKLGEGEWHHITFFRNGKYFDLYPKESEEGLKNTQNFISPIKKDKIGQTQIDEESKFNKGKYYGINPMYITILK